MIRKDKEQRFFYFCGNLSEGGSLMEKISEHILEKVIRKRAKHSHKGNYGRVCLIGGSEEFGGAIMMAAEACVHTGAGLVTVVTHPHNHSPLHARLPEAMVVDWFKKKRLASLLPEMNVIAIGPGLGTDAYSLELLSLTLQLLSKKQVAIIDGSAITLLAHYPNLLNLCQDKQIILTPHQMEWERISQLPISNQTEELNSQKQKELNMTVVLKKHGTEIYTSDTVYQNISGTPAMATGGMGDTLVGIISGFTAQFPPTTETLLGAVYLHSLLGEKIGQTAYVALPTDIIQQISSEMKKHES